MTNKAYIVANEQQEREVLEQLEKEGFMWIDHINKPTELVTSTEVSKQFPYAIVVDMNISLKLSNYFEHYEIVYDGRKEEQMRDKYVVSQEFMNELTEWKAGLNINGEYYVSDEDLFDTPVVIEVWWKDNTHALEQNNRLIAIIRWVNGEDVFEVEKPKKWVVRSKDSNDVGEHMYLRVTYTFSINHAEAVSDVYATKFDTREEAESWANSHQEVVEVED